MGWLVSLLSSGTKPLEQITKKVTSQLHFSLQNIKSRPPSTIKLEKHLSNGGYKNITTESITLEANNKMNDCWLLTNSHDYPIVRFVYADNSSLYGYKLKRKRSYYNYPLNSELFHIYESHCIKETTLFEFRLNNIYSKLFGVPTNSGTLVFFPIHHTTMQ